MITIQKDYINSHGINIKGHLVVLTAIRATTSTTTVLNTELAEPQVVVTRNASFTPLSYVSLEAYENGMQGMYLQVPNNLTGTVHLMLDEEITDNLVPTLESRLIDMMFPDQEVLAVPYSVTRRQAIQYLTALGVVDQIELIIEAIEDPQVKSMVSIYWRESTQFERSNPHLINIALALGWTEQQLDETFIAAKAL
jgi:hypothetical protein